MSKPLPTRLLAGLAVLAVLVVFPLVISDKFTLHNMIIVLLFAAMGVAWNIQGGLAGQHSMGHAVFMGLGAYTSTLLLIKLQLSPWLGMLAGTVVVGLFSLLISYPALRLHGPFFTLSSIAVLEVMKQLAVFWRPLTAGSLGLTVPMKFGWAWMSWRGKEPFYYLTLGALVLMIVLTYLIRRSRMGFYLRAIRADETAAGMLGVNPTRYKLSAVVISAVLTGMLGTVYAQYMYFIDPDSVFSLNFSIQLVLFSIIGGLDSVIGPALGAALITPLNEYLRTAAFSKDFQGLNFFLYGVGLMIVVAVIPGGIIPTLEAWWRKRRQNQAAKPRRQEVA